MTTSVPGAKSWHMAARDEFLAARALAFVTSGTSGMEGVTAVDSGTGPDRRPSNSKEKNAETPQHSTLQQSIMVAGPDAPVARPGALCAASSCRRCRNLQEKGLGAKPKQCNCPTIFAAGLHAVRHGLDVALIRHALLLPHAID